MATQAYLKYLNSNEWQCVRRISLHAAGYRCQLCASRNRLQVNHKSYGNLYRETLDDVIVLCDSCHSRFHGKLANLTGEDAWSEVVAKISEIRGVTAQVINNVHCEEFTIHYVKLKVIDVSSAMIVDGVKMKLERVLYEIFKRRIAVYFT